MGEFTAAEQGAIRMEGRFAQEVLVSHRQNRRSGLKCCSATFRYLNLKKKSHLVQLNKYFLNTYFV